MVGLLITIEIPNKAQILFPFELRNLIAKLAPLHGNEPVEIPDYFGLFHNAVMDHSSEQVLPCSCGQALLHRYGIAT